MNLIATPMPIGEAMSMIEDQHRVTVTQHYLMEFQEIKISKSTWCDNSSTAAMAVNPVLNSKTKHVDFDLHFVREKVLNNQIHVGYVPAKHQATDVFTKPLLTKAFQES
ncbi:Retrovirus-related Pol polyprotein from transposon TNT 1-94 [Gossypium australe]|uniref:Retrovirus-related Pol polyprotein from transposon TNT 1-94 n=1 Tax=Gossypium australe TaxID=47621 RepID=A0A5B6V148_9ROSI|nr:Retrovirus-related Pol polyprotein from transposon TNT 1-94 [Gossypium australe]